MSITPISRAVPPTADASVLKDLLVGVLADKTLTPRQCQDIASAIRTFAGVVDKAMGKVPGQSLAEFPAHPGVVRARTAHISAAMAGLTPGRWANTKSLVRAALKHAGLFHRPGRYREPLAPAWAALFALLDPVKDKRTRIGLSRLGGYCTAQGFSPEGLEDRILTAFLEDMRAAGSGDPRRVHRTACMVWNQATVTVEGWPRQQLTVPSYRRTYAVPRESLESTLTAEIGAWLGHLKGGDLLDESEFKPLRPRSIDTRCQQLYSYISALIRHGHAADQFHKLADVVDPDKVKDGLQFIIAHARSGVVEPSPDTGRVHVHKTAEMLVSIARHWVKADAATLTRLRGICRNLKPKRRGLSDKNRARLRQFDDPDAIDRLVTMPQRLLAAVRRVAKPSHKEALKAQLAVAIEVLLMTSLRLENLAGLSIGRSLLRSPRGLWRVAFLGDETKTDEPIDAILPVESGRMVDEYVKTYRPLLMLSASAWLFPGQKVGAAKSHNALREQIVKGVRDFCGLVINPHLIRHIGAKSYLEAHPGAYGVIRLTLGHQSMNTTIQNYCGTEGAHALAHFDAHILALRARANAAPAASKRRRSIKREGI